MPLRALSLPSPAAPRLLTLCVGLLARAASASTSSARTLASRMAEPDGDSPGGAPAGPVRAVFSDLDGTVVHFSQWFNQHGVRLEPADVHEGTQSVEAVRDADGARRRCRVLPKSTMGFGYVSDRTVELVKSLRGRGVKFVIVTAARKSTLLERLPFLPEADVAVSECGTRIYHEGVLDQEWAGRFRDVSGPLETDVAPEDRPEPLWALYKLMRLAGIKVDARSYYGCFRADDEGDPAKTAAIERFRAILPPCLSSAMNLGKCDFFPSACGKGNAVKYLQRRWGLRPEDCVALFDDDNDLPMAAACGAGFLPALTSDSIREGIAHNPTWRVADAAGQGVFAIEEVLERVLEMAPAEAPAPEPVAP